MFETTLFFIFKMKIIELDIIIRVYIHLFMIEQPKLYDMSALPKRCSPSKNP